MGKKRPTHFVAIRWNGPQMLGRDVLHVISYDRNIPWSSQKTEDFRREISGTFFSLIWDFYAIFCQVSRYNSDVTRIARTGLGTRLQETHFMSAGISPPGFPVQLLTSFPLFLPLLALNAHCTFSSVGYLRHSLHPLGAGCTLLQLVWCWASKVPRLTGLLQLKCLKRPVKVCNGTWMPWPGIASSLTFHPLSFRFMWAFT